MHRFLIGLLFAAVLICVVAAVVMIVIATAQDSTLLAQLLGGKL